MTSPLWWILKRPGHIFPVFFLSLFFLKAASQAFGQDASLAALGDSFVARADFSLASQNQAGLAWINAHSVSMSHTRPFMELGLNSLSLQYSSARGGLASSFSSYGIQGLRQSSFWISYGMNLSPVLSAGLGMHCWSSSLPEKRIYHPGLSMALGLQARLNEHWVIGAHVLHPAVWKLAPEDLANHPMIISAGCSFSFFETATLYSELRLAPERRIQWANGIEWNLSKPIGLMLGIHNLPLTWSAGIRALRKRMEVQIAFQYINDTGSIPHTSLHYAW